MLLPPSVTGPAQLPVAPPALTIVFVRVRWPTTSVPTCPPPGGAAFATKVSFVTVAWPFSGTKRAAPVLPAVFVLRVLFSRIRVPPGPTPIAPPVPRGLVVLLPAAAELLTNRLPVTTTLGDPA